MVHFVIGNANPLCKRVSLFLNTDVWSNSANKKGKLITGDQGTGESKYECVLSELFEPCQIYLYAI